MLSGSIDTLRLCRYLPANLRFSGRFSVELSVLLANPFSEYLIHTGEIEAALRPNLYAYYAFYRYVFCYYIIGGSFLTAFIFGALYHSNGYYTEAFLSFILRFINGIGLDFLSGFGFFLKIVF